MSKIAVVGSINMDLVVETDISPLKGQTVMGKNFFTSPGGKGANQAVAASRLGENVYMFGSVGKDGYGKQLIENLSKENINTKYINYVENISTGVAVIEISKNDNRIVVVAGANDFTNIEYLNKIKEELLQFDVIIMQMEIPIESVEYLTNYLYENKKIIILNPAPAKELKRELIEKVTYITPNEHEYKIILNTDKSIDEVIKEYPKKLLITWGEKGVKYFDGNEIVTVKPIKVNVVDTTGAGDTFSGAFGAAISEGKSLYDSIKFANTAAGLSITKMGAQAGMPIREEVIKIIL